MKLGELLKQQREQRNLTLRQVENKLKGKNINYSHTSIKRLENGEHEKVPIKVLSALAEIFNLDKIELFNLAGASLDEKNDDRIFQLNKDEKVQYDNFVKGANLFFNNEEVSEDDKDKLMASLNNIYFKAKEMKKKKWKMGKNIRLRVKNLIKRYKTSNPYKICERMGINLSFASLGKIKGYSRHYLGLDFIVINKELSDFLKCAVLIHELGHVVLKHCTKEILFMRKYFFQMN